MTSEREKWFLSDSETIERAFNRSRNRQDFRFQKDTKLLTSTVARLIHSLSRRHGDFEGFDLRADIELLSNRI